MSDYKDNLTRLEPYLKYIGTGDYIPDMQEEKDGDYCSYIAARSEIENCLKVIVELTHEKYQALCDVDKLKQIVKVKEVQHVLKTSGDEIEMMLNELGIK